MTSETSGDHQAHVCLFISSSETSLCNQITLTDSITATAVRRISLYLATRDNEGSKRGLGGWVSKHAVNLARATHEINSPSYAWTTDSKSIKFIQSSSDTNYVSEKWP